MFEEGDELGPVEHFLSKDQVRAYARAVDHYFPRFTDDEGARREGLPGMITPGNMSMGLHRDADRGLGRARAAPPSGRHVPRAGPARPHDPSLRRRHGEGRERAHGGARRVDRERRGRATRHRHGDGRARLKIRRGHLVQGAIR